ncbi:MAG: fructuronate reductase, partial [Clostridiales bacterium]|nr:fructuronate reductase [Clostridiales bacterium]
AEGYDYEIIEKINHPFDDYTLLATLKADGEIEKTLIGSVVESLVLDPEYSADFTRLKEIFSNPSLQMASFTITEKGYSLKDGKNEWLPLVADDLAHGPSRPKSYIGKVAALVYQRFLAKKLPIAMVSMDNCSHNGDKLYAAISSFAFAWADRGLVEADFTDYVTDSKKVSFPWTMIDKITPRPDKKVEELLIKDGLTNISPIITTKNTYVAPFVNAEECQYLVIEDNFPNGRPPLEKGGILFTQRETVDKVEKMKVCTCLNPLHTALAVFGCLLSYDLIAKEMEDADLVSLVERIGYQEGLPVVVDPGILNPKEFLDTVLRVRIPNPFMPDTPQRIATDTSQKLAIRFGETIKAYQASKTLDVNTLTAIPLVFAGWLRYLMGIDDNGNAFSLSPDPLLDSLRPVFADISLGDQVEALEVLAPILTNPAIFGVDLVSMNLAPLVCHYFEEMIQAPGAVRRTLKKAREEGYQHAAIHS